VTVDQRARVAVTAPQGSIGRRCAGASALNLVVGVLAMRDGVVPAIGNLPNPVPGYGGSNSSIVLRRPSKEPS
jgi:minimal PKS chain-length factor (CLF/KS beta)